VGDREVSDIHLKVRQTKEPDMKFTEIIVDGYRSLIDISLPLRSLAVMIGPNGSGKTALLEVFLLLKNAAQERLAGALEGHGGLDAILSKVPAVSDRLKIGLTIDVESERSQEPMAYRFELLPRGVSYAIPFIPESALRRDAALSLADYDSSCARPAADSTSR